jgi:hypothetical protein
VYEFFQQLAGPFYLCWLALAKLSLNLRLRSLALSGVKHP